jgi:hypothetical protein
MPFMLVRHLDQGRTRLMESEPSRTWIADIDHLNLRLHDRPGTRSEEAAVDTRDARRVACGRYNRWLLGRHGHQDVSPVDGEVTSNADGNPEYPDGILDHVIGLPQAKPVLGQKRLENVLVEAGRLGQQFMSTAQVQAAKSDSARTTMACSRIQRCLGRATALPNGRTPWV